MPVDKATLAAYVQELGLPADQTDSLVNTLMASENAATQFVGQRLRHADYTQKTTALAAEKRTLTDQANTQVTAYANELLQAQQKIDKIMLDWEGDKISRATAEARLSSVKTKFNLSDDDIPAVTAQPAAPPPAPIDIDAKLKAFGHEIVAKLKADMMALPQLSSIQADISAEHQELTGKRMTQADWAKVLKTAETDRIRLQDAWEKEYAIAPLRTNKLVEAEVTKRMAEAESKRKQKASEDALAGVSSRGGVDSTQQALQSPVMRRQYANRDDVQPQRPAQTQQQQQAPAQQQAPTQQQQQQRVPSLSGAERAAARFMERRNNGIPMGAPDPAPAT